MFVWMHVCMHGFIYLVLNGTELTFKVLTYFLSFYLSIVDVSRFTTTLYMYIYAFFSMFFSIIDYCRILNMAPYAIQQVFAVCFYFVYLNSKLQIYLPTSFPL